MCVCARAFVKVCGFVLLKLFFIFVCVFFRHEYDVFVCVCVCLKLVAHTRCRLYVVVSSICPFPSSRSRALSLMHANVAGGAAHSVARLLLADGGWPAWVTYGYLDACIRLHLQVHEHIHTHVHTRQLTCVWKGKDCQTLRCYPCLEAPVSIKVDGTNAHMHRHIPIMHVCLKVSTCYPCVHVPFEDRLRASTTLPTFVRVLTCG